METLTDLTRFYKYLKPTATTSEINSLSKFLPLFDNNKSTVIVLSKHPGKNAYGNLCKRTLKKQDPVLFILDDPEEA